jgi:hypothetical protein
MEFKLSSNLARGTLDEVLKGLSAMLTLRKQEKTHVLSGGVLRGLLERLLSLREGAGLKSRDRPRPGEGVLAIVTSEDFWPTVN